MDSMTPPLTPDEERRINEMIFRGVMADEGWIYYDSGLGRNVPFMHSTGTDPIPPFTRSLDSLRMAEERLSPEQRHEYAVALDSIFAEADAQSGFKLCYNGMNSLSGIKGMLRLPASVRARALAAVLEEG